MPAVWRRHLGAVAAVVLSCLVVFWQSWASMVEIWWRSNTYNHGFLIAPISLWLVWSQRHQIKRLAPGFSYSGLLLAAAAGALWLCARLSHVLMIEQFAVVMALLGGLWTVLGNQVAAALRFPLGFLLFMVPVGEGLIPPLIEFTTDFTVTLLRLTGLPVYREGNFFTLTSGSWSVVEACSGISYLLASVTLGVIYAYLNYASHWKRGLFVVASLIVPVIANGLRAYLIVMIGHLSDMTLAVGVDHLLYGGLFFGVVIFLLFYLGSFWRDPPFTPVVPARQGRVAAATVRRLGAWSTAVVAVFLVWPASHARLTDLQSPGMLPAALLQARHGDWRQVEHTLSPWQPAYDAAIDQKTRHYRHGDALIGVHVASFGREQQGRELVNSQNTLINPRDSGQWRLLHSGTATVTLGADQHTLSQSVIGADGRELLVVEWFQLGGEISINPYQVKAMQLLKRLVASHAPELKMVVWTEVGERGRPQAQAVIEGFLRAWHSENQKFWLDPP